MPELGQYAGVILSAWGVGLGLIAALVWASVSRARRVKAELDRIERGGS